MGIGSTPPPSWEFFPSLTVFFLILPLLKKNIQVQGWVSSMVSSNEADDPIIEEKLEELDRSDKDVENLREWRMENDAEPDYHYPEPDHVYLSFNLNQS